MLDGCSKIPVVLKTKERSSSSSKCVNLLTHLLTHRHRPPADPPVYMDLSWASALIILWSQVQVLVGPPEK